MLNQNIADSKQGGIAADGRDAQRHGKAATNAALGILAKYSQTTKKDGVLRSFQTLDKESGELLTLDQIVLKDGSTQIVKSYDQESADLEKWLMKQSARRLLKSVSYRPVRRQVPYSELLPAPSNGKPYYITGQCRKSRFLLVDDVGFQDGYFTPVKRASDFRVVNCMRDRQSNSDSVEVWQSGATGRCNLRKVVTCGSPWNCPHCSDKISRARRSQIQAVYDEFLTDRHNSDCLMLTLTFRHGLGDDLDDVFSKMKLAREAMRKSHGYQKLFMGQKIRGFVSAPVYAFLGHVSASELTHGFKNGWHPHLHELFFFDSRIEDIDALRSELFRIWCSACVKVGLQPPVEFYRDYKTGLQKPLGVDLRRAYSAAEYLSKFPTSERGGWGVENEMTRQNAKAARLDRRTPFQILSDYTFATAQTEQQKQDKARDGALFIDYAEATLGKHQLDFSPTLLKNLKARGVDPKDFLISDDVLAAQETDQAALLGALTDDDFTCLGLGERHNMPAMHGNFLAKCKRDGFGLALVWLRAFAFYPKTKDDFNDSYCPF